MESYSAMISRIRREEKQKALREVRRNGEAGGCLLGDKTICEGRGCATCGFERREAQRRSRLPLWRNSKGLWKKHVGRSKEPA